jgi:glucose-1-phosphate adenylyltransferase
MVVMAPSTKNKKQKSHVHDLQKYHSVDMSRVAAIILGGGQGTRLFPLTQTRCKPALNFGGRFHLIDVPISNAINSGISIIYVITQFLSSSLHRHIFKTYRHGNNFNGFIEMLPAEERPSKKEWFQGTADAVRQNLPYLFETPVDYFLILSGDQLYRFNFQQMLHLAHEKEADLVVATIAADQDSAKRMGILKVDENGFITDFAEKPQDANILEKLIYTQKTFKKISIPYDKNTPYLASMGIYLFKRQTLFDILSQDLREDFGKHLIPAMIDRGNTAVYPFQGYWEDIGTIESFYKANMALTDTCPLFDCYNERYPIFSDMTHLPGPKIYNGAIKNSIICEGCVIEAELISHSILGPRTIVKKDTAIQDSYIMGNNYYKSPFPNQNTPKELFIGENCHLKKVILDKHVHIGNHVKLINQKNLHHYDGQGIYIRDGIIVVSKEAVIPDGFIL